LEKLESEGYILREHGGAFLKNVEHSVKSFTLLNQENLGKKILIGRKAAELIEASDVTYLVADSTKIGKNAFAILGALSLIDYIITDPFIDQSHLQLFRDNEIELIIAK